jgi:Fe2+ or Zn2+ uptake regulation protein
MNPRNILKENNFRVTSHRCDVLNYFINSKNALSHADLENVFKNKLD